jgi:hypothetical protein
MNESLLKKSNEIDWQEAERFLQLSRFKPIYDRAFHRLLEELMEKGSSFSDPSEVRALYLTQMDEWFNSSKINCISGLDNFPDRDVIIGVTHALDDLHITYHQSIVILDKTYAYYKRIRPDIKVRTIETLQTGDVLVFEAPFAHYGDLHPDTSKILDRCEELNIPVHIDAAWYGCLRDFSFDYSHPAIQSVSFSLSKGLGLGSHRTGVRYSKKRWPGPVTISNDFNMNVISSMRIGMKFMEKFHIDYAQNKYSEAYSLVCEKLNLKPTKAIHIAFKDNNPVGIRAFLRTLVDDVIELK